MAKSRLIGDYPVIGIRPIIDARRGPLGVRQSLEEQTMGMALAAKKLFEENIRYSNGEPVKVVISDTTIASTKTHHRQSCRGSRLRRSVQKRGRGYHSFRHSLLVLRLRDDGYG